MAILEPYNDYYPIQYDYVQQLPYGWQLLPNIAIFDERKERGTQNEETLSISAIRGIIKSSDYENRKDRTSENKSQYLLVKKDDLAYNTMLMWDGAIGHSAFRGIVSPAYTVLKPKKIVNPKYYHYLFRAEFYKNYSKRHSYGIVDARLRLYYVHFKRMYSIVPPLETQNAIVEYLDRKNAEIDAFISKKQRLIELLKEKIYLLINSNTAYKEEKAKWIFDEINIKNNRDEELLAVTQDRGVLPKNLCEENFVSPNNTEGLKLVSVNDFVISLRSFQGGIEYSNYQGIVSPAYNVIRLNPCFNNLLYLNFYKYYFKSPKLISLLNTVISGIRDGQNINWNDFKNLELALPATDSMEDLIPLIKSYETLKLDFEIEAKKVEEYRQALITDMVTGKYKVPQLQTAEI
ncbi:MAG TPA: hypothetical protein VEC12_06750 [Bacteroidia bacterium]|nr:hypothetical protein [Bacteroidia bacterium]